MAPLNPDRRNMRTTQLALLAALRRPGTKGIKQMIHRSERNRQIIDLHLAGETLASIGARFGLTRQAVHYIIKETSIRDYLEDMEQLEKQK